VAPACRSVSGTSTGHQGLATFDQRVRGPRGGGRPCRGERAATHGVGRGLPDARPAAGWHPGIPERRRRRPLDLPDENVGEEDEAVTNGLGIDEAHWLLVGGLAEEALAGPEHDWEDDQPQLVDQVMLD
jgi:hypothetical protein